MSLASSHSCWVFDVDGVLADTRDAVRESYAIAGVDQPDDVWGISWKLWLPAIVGIEAAPHVHGLKQEAYAKLLETGAAQRLPGADAAKALMHDGHHVYFVTAASESSAASVLRALKLPQACLEGVELTAAMRTGCLSRLKRMHEDARLHVYVDDREEGAKIAADAGFRFAHARWTL